MARFRAGIRMCMWGDPGKMPVRKGRRTRASRIDWGKRMPVRKSGPQGIHRKGRRTRVSRIDRGKRLPVRSRGPWIHIRGMWGSRIYGGSPIDRGKVFEAPSRSTWIHTRAVSVSPHDYI